MKKINIFTVEKKDRQMSTGHKILYATGEISNNLVWGLLTNFLLIFYTNIFKLRPSDIAILFIVARVIDAVNDPVIGSIIDHSHSRWGKFRPYFIACGIPVAALLLLCFTAPDLAYRNKLIYAYITYIGLCVLYAFASISYNSMVPTLTTNSQERIDISVLKSLCQGLGQGIVTVGIPLFVVYFGKKFSSLPNHRQDHQVGYFISVIIIAVLCVIFYLLPGFTTKEHHAVIEKRQSFTLKQGFRYVFTNVPMLCAIIYLFSSQMISGMKASALIYYFKYNSGDERLMSINSIACAIPGLIAVLLTPMIVKKLGSRNGELLSVAGTAVLSAVLWFVPDNQPYVFITLTALSGLFGFGYAIYNGLIADSVDYGEWKSGARADALTFSLGVFMQKLATAVSGALSAAMLGWVCFKPEAVHQSAQALTGIKLMVSIIPAIFACIGFVMFFYKLTPAKHKKIIEELEAKKAAKTPVQNEEATVSADK